MDVVLNTWRKIRRASNLTIAWVDNFRRLQSALKSWASSKRIMNKNLKDKILHDIELLDKKEEKVDLWPQEFETRKDP